MAQTNIPNKEKLDKSESDIIYLLTCCIHNELPEKERVDNMELEQVYRIGKRHSLEAMVYMALEQVLENSEMRNSDLLKMWREEKEKAIRKSILMDAEQKQICHEMEQHKIWYVPLKGMVLKKMYPKVGMRQMADCDILYDEQHQEKLMQIMVKRGYDVKVVGKGNHDVYLKEPIYNFEMHTSLYNKSWDEWCKYYKDVKSRLINDLTNEYHYRFSDEDFYVYILTHMYKHYSFSGTGLRSLVDIYVYLQNKAEVLDWKYIKGELKELGILEFEKQVREVSQKLFSKQYDTMTSEEERVCSYVINSGVYGNMKNRIAKRVSRLQGEEEQIGSRTVLMYYWERLVPGMDFYKNYVPVVYKYKILIPFYLLYRFFRGIIKKRKSIINEIRVFRKIRKEQEN